MTADTTAATPPRAGSGESRIAALLARTQAGLDRVHATDLAAEVAAGALVVDVRPIEQRRRDGELPGSVVIDRNVLEWRLDPTSPDRLPGLDLSADRRVVLVCNEGYSSSLAAAVLQRLGLSGATDLVDGFQAWSLLVRDTTSAPGSGPAADQTGASSANGRGSEI